MDLLKQTCESFFYICFGSDVHVGGTFGAVAAGERVFVADGEHAGAYCGGVGEFVGFCR